MENSLCKETSIMSNASLSHQCALDYGTRFFYEFLQMFYIVFPSENLDQEEPDVNYEVNLIPMVGLFVLIEQILRLYQRKDLTRLQDFVTNVGSAIIFLFARILFLGVFIHFYIYLYNNYKIIDLPLHSIWTWLVSLLLVEFVYYWTHRALHEFNILWAAHQFHHMAEDVNVTTSIRDSVVDLLLYDIFPLPLAFLVPPQILVVHMQFSLIYQIWLHNSVVGDMGFIEYLVNTPRQHLVHHGKNPYCIDKNYGALLMIWDRIFGTYQKERKEDEIVFGVVSPTPDTFDPMVLQFGYYREVYEKFRKMDNLNDKMSALFKGPGWSPGKPRLGLISDVPEPDRNAPKYTYDPRTSLWIKAYVSLHLIALLVGLYLIGHHTLIRFSYTKSTSAMVYILLSLISFGFIFDSKKIAPYFEIFRCLCYFAFDHYIIMSTPWELGKAEQMVSMVMLTSLRLYYAGSILLWTVRAVIGHQSNPQWTKHNGTNGTNGCSEQVEVCDTKKENGTTDPSHDLEVAKTIAAKNMARRFDVQNLAATAIFLLSSLVILNIVYFIRLESCSKMLDEALL